MLGSERDDAAGTPMPVRPAYDGAWIGALLPALVDGEPPAWVPASARDAEAVVLLVLDGLGWHALEELGGELVELSAMDGAPITTCAPSTTSSALTSLTTGLSPARHGVVGMRIHVDGGILDVLHWEHSEEGVRPEPAAVQPHSPFGGRSVAVVSRSQFARTGFSEAHLRGTRLFGWRTPAVLVERCRRLVREGERFVYAYYDGVDQVAHECGLADGYFAVEVAAADRLVGELRDALPASCALVVTADHGQVHIAPGGVRDLSPVESLCVAYSGDGRCRGLHARDGAAAELTDAARAAFGGEAWVLTRDELLDEGWLGAAPTQATRRRVADVTVAAHAPIVHVPEAYAQERRLKASHGSFTAAEMLVPLLAARGRGG